MYIVQVKNTIFRKNFFLLSFIIERIEYLGFHVVKLRLKVE